MESTDVWKLVLGGVITLCSGALLLQLQMGGRRRRRRRDIKEQLELLALLDDHPAVAARVRRRVEVALEQYEPPTHVRQKRRERRVAAAAFAPALALMVLVVEVFDLELADVWTLTALGVLGALFANAMDAGLSRWLQTREQDEAVAQGSGSGTLTFKGSGTGHAGPPSDREQ